ncbi:MAG: hypothetical protein GY870_17605, partial [archaeon]|nr:hypothetical protein [archaeon]
YARVGNPEEIEKALRKAVGYTKINLRISDSIPIEIDGRTKLKSKDKIEQEDKGAIKSKSTYDAYQKGIVNNIKKCMIRYMKMDTKILSTVIEGAVMKWKEDSFKSCKEFAKMDPSDQFRESIKIYDLIYRKMTYEGMGVHEDIEKAIRSALGFHKTSLRISETIPVEIAGRTKLKSKEKIIQAKKTKDSIPSASIPSAYQKSVMKLFKKFIIRYLKADFNIIEECIYESISEWTNETHTTSKDFFNLPSKEQFLQSLKIYDKLNGKLRYRLKFNDPKEIEKAIRGAIGYHKVSLRVLDKVEIELSN